MFKKLKDLFKKTENNDRLVERLEFSVKSEPTRAWSYQYRFNAAQFSQPHHNCHSHWPWDFPKDKKGGSIVFSSEIRAAIDDWYTEEIKNIKAELENLKERKQIAWDQIQKDLVNKEMKEKSAKLKKILKKKKNAIKKTIEKEQLAYTEFTKGSQLIERAFDSLEETYKMRDQWKVSRDYTLNRAMYGVYKHRSPSGRVMEYTNHSKSITLGGLGSNELIEFAQALAKEYKQGEVLVYDFNTEEIQFVKYIPSWIGEN